VLGAVITFLFYGVLPVGLVVYLMGTPARKRAIKAKEQAELAAAQAAAVAAAETSGLAPDANSQAAADPVAPVRKEA
jgi:hypothetical protein